MKKLEGVILTTKEDSNGDIMDFKGMVLPKDNILPVTLNFGEVIGKAKVEVKNGKLVAKAEVKLQEGINEILYPSVFGTILERAGNIVKSFSISGVTLSINPNVDSNIKPLKESIDEC